MNRIRRARLLFGTFALVALTALAAPAVYAAEPKPVFDSKTVTSSTKGRAVAVDVDVRGAKELYLVVGDAGDGFSCDWADWAEPRFLVNGAEKKLTDLKWKSAAAGWGNVRVNRNANGGPLRIAGENVAYGVGTHAPSVIVYDVPAGATRFKARAGLDNGGTDQGDGNTTSVQFLVYTQKPPAHVLRTSTNSGGGASRDAKDAVDNLDAADGLETTLFAAEPTLKSPSNFDVDHLGRVWVCEVVNYRRFRNKNNPLREAGDRILILEDATGDGKADKSTVFYQGRDIDSAHGICVLGTPDGKNTRAIVSAGDGVFVFTDKDGDGKADSKQTLFTGISGTQHDHGIHAFVFGPDGKLYFNFGNSGKQIKDKDGKPIVDKSGRVVNDRRQPYQEGMVFRCNLDGSEFETLGWNFRNNWEAAVDSFGTIWQSDNDDDGNRGVRINYVMEFGNYGYKDELTGSGWRSPRTGMHPEIPKRHWHLNDPGVVPNLLQTYAGSPTGICVYEGTLLPERFHNQLLHCDAGPNVVRAYATSNDGAGYKATVHPILTGERDKWFRPSDVCVAPDGSIFIADWYDPGVGGHAQGDVDRGRIFRIAPPKTPYKVPEYNFQSTDGLIEALKSPNLAARYVAWRGLHQLGAKAERPLKEVFESSDNPRHRARALWLLGKIDGRGPHYVERAIADENPDVRITGLRLARQIDADVPRVVERLVNDKSPQVRRECAIALAEFDDKTAGSKAVELWTKLALQHDGKDRWHLEALGIAARGREDACLTAWLERVGDKWDTPAGRDILWRSRSTKATPYLAEIILDPKTGAQDRLRYFRAFDFHRPNSEEGIAMKRNALVKIATADPATVGARAAGELTALAMKHMGRVDLNRRPELKAAVDRALDAAKGTEGYVRMVADLEIADRYPDLLQLAQKHPAEQLGVEAIRALLAKRQFPLIRRGLDDDDPKVAAATATALGSSAEGSINGLLRPIITDRKRDAELRRAAVAATAKTRNGARELVGLAQQKKLDKSLEQSAALALHAANWADVKSQAERLFPLPKSKDKPLPPIADLLRRKGDVEKGRVVFNTVGTCAKCHQVNGFGKEVGPDLSEIGRKLGRRALFESIIFPSAGISHNYESYVIALESGNTVTGLVTSRTADAITIKDTDAISRTFKTSEVEFIRKQTVSLMPADLQKTITLDQLIDVVEYMTTLKKAEKAKPAEE